MRIQDRDQDELPLNREGGCCAEAIRSGAEGVVETINQHRESTLAENVGRVHKGMQAHCGLAEEVEADGRAAGQQGRRREERAEMASLEGDWAWRGLVRSVSGGAVEAAPCTEMICGAAIPISVIVAT